MRWFVEVSRVGENSSDEKYCVEAKQWQAALQEARKLRGDSGPLSKFSIELLDDGYRAVDPKLKLRFVVAKAPPDAELTSNSADAPSRPDGPPLNGQSVPAPAASLLSTPPTASASSPAPASAFPSYASSPLAAPATAAVLPSVVPLAAPAVATPAAIRNPSVPPGAVVASPSAAPRAGVQTPSAAPPPVAVGSASSAASAPSAVPAPAATAPSASPAVSPGFVTTEPYAGVPSSALSPLGPEGIGKTPSAFPPRPEGSVRPATSGGITVPADVIPAAPAVPKGLGPSVPQNHTQPSAAYELPPPSTVLRKRQEDPTPESPITYREVAYVVEPGATRGSIEALLWANFKNISRELAERPGQKFVQLAVFDHKFDKRPERAPLGTLAWKDWRGNPVITFPFFDGTAPARASVPAPSIVPLPVVKVTSSAPPPPPAEVAAPVTAAPSAVTAAPSAVTAAPSAVTAAPLAVAAAPSAVAPSGPVPSAASTASAGLSSPPGAAMPISDARAAAIPPTRERLPSQPGAARERLPSHPSATRSSKPRLAAVRRRAGEDLIGELFETMHDLHFMSGVADGAEFMMETIDSIVPCEGALIHVFDINTRQFVVVRAKGPGAADVLLQRTPDTEPFFNSVMRRPGSVAIHDVGKDPRVLGPRWDALRVKPSRAMCGPVRQGGRYLGLLEVVNPLGDAPFHQTEQNALDYVCAQFAEFLANRPLVLEADMIVRR